MRREALLWLRMAETDLEDARVMLRLGRWFRAAFFAQQAVEKALKALYIALLRVEPPKTHVVTELYRGLTRCFRLPANLEEQLPTLTKYYLVTRYPDAAGGPPEESVDRLEAERVVALAERVVRLAWEAAERGCRGAEEAG